MREGGRKKRGDDQNQSEMLASMKCGGCFSTLSLGAPCPCNFDKTASAPVNVLPPGTRIFSESGNTYLLGMVLGTGTFAIAYLAWDEVNERRVAIKEFMPREICYRERGSHDVHVFNGNSQKAFDRGIEGFVNEAAILKTFDHPNIVTVLDFFRANSTAYLVMPYFDSATLGEYLDLVPNGRLPPETAVKVMVAILDGLRHVHRNRVDNRRWSHRDIKPSNILLRAGNSPLLIDFGAARIEVSDRDKAYSIIVTPGYAPPEQYGGGERSRGPWVDVYACAATLYQALTGAEPEDAPVRQDAVSSGEPDPLVPPASILPDIGQHVSDVVMHGMKLDYRQRPQDAEEFKGMLLGEIPLPQAHLHSAQLLPEVVGTEPPPLESASQPTFTTIQRPSPAHDVDVPPPLRKGVPTQVAVAAMLLCVVLAGASIYLWDQLERTRAAFGAAILEAEESRKTFTADLNKERELRAAIETKFKNEIAAAALRENSLREQERAAAILAAETEDRNRQLAEEANSVRQQANSARAQADARAQLAESQARSAEAKAKAAEAEAGKARRRAAAADFLAGTRSINVQVDEPGSPLRYVEATLSMKDGQVQVSSLVFRIDHARADASPEYLAIKSGKDFGIYFGLFNSGDSANAVTSSLKGYWRNPDTNVSALRTYSLRVESGPASLSSMPCSADSLASGNCYMGAWVKTRDGKSGEGRSFSLGPQLDR